MGIYDVEVSNSNTAWFLAFRFGAENTGQIAYTNDAGKSLHVRDIPLNGVPYLPCMTTTDEQTAYVMALQDWGHAVTLKTTDAGVSWIDCHTPWDTVVSWPDYIHAFSKDTICQIGDPRDGEFEIYTSDDAATSWKKVDGSFIPDPLPGEFGFNNCGDHHGSHIWFGTNQGRLYHSPDKGYNWEVFTSPLTGMAGLSFSDAEKGVIAGPYGIADSVTTRLYRTNDGGHSWTELFLPITEVYHFYGVPYYIRGSSVLVAGVYTNPQLFGKNQTWISFDDGLNWIYYSDGEIAGWPEFLNSETGWAAEWGPKIPGGETQIFKYVGQPLRARQSKIWKANDPEYPLPNLACSAIDAVNDQSIWAVHSHLSVNDSLYGYFIDSLVRTGLTKDGGKTWEHHAVPLGNPAFVANISAIDGNTAWLAGIDGGGVGSKILKTEDGGKSWTLQSSAAWDPVVSWVDFVHFWSPAKGIAVGDPRDGEFEIYTTGNGGQFWSRIGGDKIPDALAGEFGYNNGFDVVGNTLWFATNKGRVFRSNNGGASWDVFETGLPDGALEFGDNMHGLFYYNDYLAFTSRIRISRDAGSTWEEMGSMPENGNVRINALEFVPGSNVIVMTTSNYSLTHGLFRTWISSDLGLSWKEVDNTTNIVCMEFTNPQNGWGGQGQLLNGPSYLFNYSGSPLTGLLTLKELNVRMDCFPNPVSDVLLLNVHSEQSEDYLVLIHDANGNLIFSDHIQHESEINRRYPVDFLTQGNYFITLSNHLGSKSISFTKL